MYHQSYENMVLSVLVVALGIAVVAMNLSIFEPDEAQAAAEIEEVLKQVKKK